MAKDRFWKSLWLSSLGVLLICIATSAALFFSHIGAINTAAVGIDYSPDKDPFQTDLRKSSYSVTSGYIYNDAFPLGITTWSWDASMRERSKEQVYDGSASLKITFKKAWAGAGLNGISINTQSQRSLSLAVYPDASVGDLFVELYGKNGQALGRQSLGFYTASGSLTPNTWQVISIPIQNLYGAGDTTITALAISTTNPGDAYIDALQFKSTALSHEKWVYKAPVGPQENVYVPPPFNPFATSTPEPLPYNYVHSPTPDPRWYGLRGYFEETYDAFNIGPQKGNNDAFAFYRNGRNWGDYQMSATVEWGGARVFALIVRMSDENNYVSCSYSSAGDTVQMYSVENGVSNLITQSDKLHYSDYTGGVVHVGAQVHGHTLVCGLDGNEILTKEITSMPQSGTVGMEAYDPDDNTGAHHIDSLKVVPLVGE